MSSRYVGAYGAEIAELFQRMAGYADRTLKGAEPADLPVEQPTKLVLAINSRQPRNSASRCRHHSSLAPTK
jgi:hypothetical protein